MNFEDARFPSPLPSFCGGLMTNANDGLSMVRQSSTTQFNNFQTETNHLNVNSHTGYGMPTPFTESLINRSWEEDLPIENGRDFNMATLGINLNPTGVGQNSLQSKDSVPKRLRTTFSPSQLNRLESEFQCNNYVVGLKRMRLAEELKLDEKQVKIWFQNRRMKFKRERQNIQKKIAQNAHYYCYY